MRGLWIKIAVVLLACGSTANAWFHSALGEGAGSSHREAEFLRYVYRFCPALGKPVRDSWRGAYRPADWPIAMMPMSLDCLGEKAAATATVGEGSGGSADRLVTAQRELVLETLLAPVVHLEAMLSMLKLGIPVVSEPQETNAPTEIMGDVMEDDSLLVTLTMIVGVVLAGMVFWLVMNRRG